MLEKGTATIRSAGGREAAEAHDVGGPLLTLEAVDVWFVAEQPKVKDYPDGE